jgi:hypothetical protein
MLVPVESVPMRVTYWIAGPQAYREYLRPLMTLLFLPLWVLTLVPPLGESPSRRMYYVLMWACVFCTVGLASITTGSGERIRFIVLATMLPVMVWNAQALYEYAAGRIGRRTRHEAGLAS